MSANPDQVELDPGNVEALLAVRAQIAALKDTETRLRQAIEHQLGDHGTGTLDGTPVISWMPVKSRRFDQAAFKKAHPDLAAEFVTTSESRPFKVVAG